MTYPSNSSLGSFLFETYPVDQCISFEKKMNSTDKESNVFNIYRFIWRVKCLISILYSLYLITLFNFIINYF